MDVQAIENGAPRGWHTRSTPHDAAWFSALATVNPSTDELPRMNGVARQQREMAHPGEQRVIRVPPSFESEDEAWGWFEHEANLHDTLFYSLSAISFDLNTQRVTATSEQTAELPGENGVAQPVHPPPANETSPQGQNAPTLIEADGKSALDAASAHAAPIARRTGQALTAAPPKPLMVHRGLSIRPRGKKIRGQRVANVMLRLAREASARPTRRQTPINEDVLKPEGGTDF